MAEHIVVVGASLAGCTAATFLARQGADVTLIERSPDPQHYKRVCGHFIQSSSRGAIERLGILEAMRDAGAVETRSRLHTRYGVIASDAVPASLNLRREKLDPIVRAHAAATPGVTLLAGAAVTGLLPGGTGVELRDGRRIAADLVVGADGRDSKVAALADVPERVFPHGRFAYGAYYEGPRPEGAPDGTLWFLDPGWAAAFPTDDGLTLYGVMPTHAHLPAYKADPGAALEREIASLPDAPPIRESRRVGDVMGRIQLPNRMRRPVGERVALVGDAALATDPVWGVGCGWAFQTSEWLADAVAPWLRGEESLERGLRRYRRTWTRRLALHARMIHDYAGGRPFTGMEKALWSAAARDPKLAQAMGRVGIREVSPLAMMRPATVARIARAQVRRRRGRDYSSTTRTSPSLTA